MTAANEAQIGMFAYTGLKPEQMEVLANEVSVITQNNTPANGSAFGVRDQGRPDLGGRYHHRQCQETCGVDPQGDGLNGQAV